MQLPYIYCEGSVEGKNEAQKIVPHSLRNFWAMIVTKHRYQSWWSFWSGLVCCSRPRTVIDLRARRSGSDPNFPFYPSPKFRLYTHNWPSPDHRKLGKVRTYINQKGWLEGSTEVLILLWQLRGLARETPPRRRVHCFCSVLHLTGLATD